MPMKLASSSTVIFCGGNSLLELLLHVVQAGLAVEHFEDGELFLLKAEVVQPDRLLDDPVDPALIAMRWRPGRAACASAPTAPHWKPDCLAELASNES